MKLLQLNIWKGRFINDIIKFIQENEIDICHFQEVSGGSASQNNQDDFEYLKEKLNWNGEIVKTIEPTDEKTSFFGNATFFNDKFKLLDKKTVWMKDFNPDYKASKLPVNPKVMTEKEFKEYPFTPDKASRAALILQLEFEGKMFYSVNTHLAWGRDQFDEPYKIKQAKILTETLGKLEYPILLSGDFNVTSDTEIVKLLSKFGRNLTKENNIEYTLNPKTHYLKEEVIKNKLAIDFILPDPSFKIGEFKALEETLSDHKGLLLYFSI